jgi:hypothetical protein
VSYGKSTGIFPTDTYFDMFKPSPPNMKNAIAQDNYVKLFLLFRSL